MNAALTLAVIDAFLCTLIALRLLVFKRAGAAHRPAVSLLAYAVIVAAGAVPLLLAFAILQPPGLHRVVLDAVLCLAVFAVRGNLMELFRSTDGDGPVARLLRGGRP